MWCSKCGRVYKDPFCKKCKIEIPEENKTIPYKLKPSVVINFVAFVFFPIFLFIELFISHKTPKDRAGIECAKKAFWYLLIIFLLWLVSYIGRMYVSDMFIWLLYAARVLSYGTIIFMIIVILGEKNGAEKVYDENGLEVSN